MLPPFDRLVEAYPRPWGRNRLPTVVLGVALAVVLSRLWRRPFRVVVEGTSMQPSLRAGDYLLAVRGGRIRRASLVVAERPARRGQEMVKRVAGVPGDTVDGVRLGAGRYWLLGDDPSGSTDSRTFGPVPEELVRGVIVARYWPPSAVRWFAGRPSRP